MAGQRVNPVTKGDTGRTMMHASVANEVISAVNEHDVLLEALKKISVSPSGAGYFKVADGNIVLVLNTVQCPAA